MPRESRPSAAARCTIPACPSKANTEGEEGATEALSGRSIPLHTSVPPRSLRALRVHSLRGVVIAGTLLATTGAGAQVDFGPLKYEKLATKRETEQRMLTLLQNKVPVQWGEWWILSPFDGRERGTLGKPLPPEEELEKMRAGGPGPDLRKEYEGKRNTKPAWKSLGQIDNTPIDLRIHKENALNTNGTAYLYRTATVDADVAIDVTMGSDDGLRFWLNGDLLIDADVPRGLNADDHKLTLNLKKGVNHLFCKVTQGAVGWDYQLVTNQPLDSATDAKLQYQLNLDFPSAEDGSYPVATIPVPEAIVLEVGGLDVLPDGRAVVCTRRGDVFIVDRVNEATPFSASYKLFATGLHEPLGVAVGRRTMGPGWRTSREPWAVYCVQRGELTRLVDTNGDDRADLYETVCADWGVSGNYHEFAFGPKFDDNGNAWVTLNVGFCDSLGKSVVPYRGWGFTVSPEGTLTPIASGLRSPNGIGVVTIGKDTVAMYADNQGDYVGTNRIQVMAPGGWVGHPSSLRWREGWNQGDPLPERQKASIWLPYRKMGQSVADIVVDTTEGKFGPFAGQAFCGDQTLATVMRIAFEKVTGKDGNVFYQGACFPFREGLDCGVNRLAFDNTGAMLVGETDRGWGSVGRRRYGLQRIAFTGKTPFEVLTMQAAPDGFVLTFTQDVDRAAAADPKSYRFSSYSYNYHAKYGSEETQTKQGEVKSATVLGPRTVRVVLDEMRSGGEGFVYEMEAAGVKNSDGKPLLHTKGYYTLQVLPAEAPAVQDPSRASR
jgi:hypothetical protein